MQRSLDVVPAIALSKLLTPVCPSVRRGFSTPEPSMPQHPDKPVVETTTDARAGVTGHNVRYVLLFSLGGVLVAFAALLWYFANG